MAVARPKWPMPISFDDDDPKPGFVFVTLTVEGLQVVKQFGLIGTAKPKNATIKYDFKPELVIFNIIVTNNSGEVTVYEYKKPLPENINPQNSTYKVANGKVTLVLAKEEKQSWVQHAKHFIKPETAE